jgi:hypothetical protein
VVRDPELVRRRVLQLVGFMGWASINFGTVVASSRLSADLPLSLLLLELSTNSKILPGGWLSLALLTSLECPLCGLGLICTISSPSTQNAPRSGPSD